LAKPTCRNLKIFEQEAFVLYTKRGQRKLQGGIPDGLEL